MTTSLTVRRKEFAKNKQIKAQLNSDDSAIMHHYFPSDNGVLHLVGSAKPAKHRIPILFLHGTPGSWGSFARYLVSEQLQNDFSLYLLDRPGWGESNLNNRVKSYRLSEQSKLIAPAIDHIQKNHEHGILVIGHSFGGSLAPVVATDYPQQVSTLLILAGDLDAVQSTPRWFNFCLDVIPKSCMPENWYHSNKEVMKIKADLKNLQGGFADLNLPIYILQGEKDGLVRPENASIAPQIFVTSKPLVKMLPNATHIIHLTHTQEVINTIKLIQERDYKSL